MGLCGKNKAKVAKQRARTAGVDGPVEPAAVAAADEALSPPVEVGEVSQSPACEVKAAEASPMSVNEFGTELEADEGAEASQTLAPPRGLGVSGVHSQHPPARHASTATSCAGMTDAEYLSRRGTLQNPEQQQRDASAVESPRTDPRAEPSHPLATPREDESHAVEESPHFTPRSEEPKTAETRLDEEEAEVQEPFARTLTREMSTQIRDTYQTVRESLSRGYASVNGGVVGDSIRRVATGDFSDLHPVEACLYGAMTNITELSERTMPCIFGVHEDAMTESPTPKLPHILMSIHTPGGPYLRAIPDELVGDAINMGFISQDEVQRQREEWEKSCGRVPVEYTPAMSLAEGGIAA